MDNRRRSGCSWMSVGISSASTGSDSRLLSSSSWLFRWDINLSSSLTTEALSQWGGGDSSQQTVFSDISRGYLLDQKSFTSLTDSFFTNVKAVRGGGAGARDFVHPVPADCPPTLHLAIVVIIYSPTVLRKNVVLVASTVRIIALGLSTLSMTRIQAVREPDNTESLASSQIHRCPWSFLWSGRQFGVFFFFCLLHSAAP